MQDPERVPPFGFRVPEVSRRLHWPLSSVYKAIQTGDNPRLVERKLKTFLPPAARKELNVLETAK